MAFVTLGESVMAALRWGWTKNGGQEKTTTDSQASPTVMLLDDPGRSPGS
jgi:hypothetical protein